MQREIIVNDNEQIDIMFDNIFYKKGEEKPPSLKYDMKIKTFLVVAYLISYTKYAINKLLKNKQ